MTDRIDQLSERARWFLNNFDEIDLAEICASKEADIAACIAQQWPQRLAAAEQQIARIRKVIAERRAEVAEREADGMLPFGTPGASWCDAITVTCARIDDALKIHPEPVGIPCSEEQS